MSHAVETEPVKPAVPLGSFLGKLAPKPAEKAVEVKTEVKDEPTKTVPTDTKETDGAKAIGTQAADATVADRNTETGLKTEDKPKDDKTEKRLKDAQTWGNEEHKARLKAEREANDLKAQLKRIEENQKVLGQKLDGTYVEQPDPTPEQVAYDAEMRGKLRASHRAAVRKHGEAKVMELVWNPNSPYQQLAEANPLMAQRVLASDDPVQEAIEALQAEEDAKKYGRTSEEWKRSIEEELRPQLEKTILDGLKTKAGPATNTLGNVRGEAERTSQKEAPTHLDLRRVFPWGASRT